MISFDQYLRLRENDQFGFDHEGGDIDKLNHFMLLALTNPDIRGSLYPILSQIAGQDDTGEMQELLKQVDINNLGCTAKKLLKSKKGVGQLPPPDDKEMSDKKDVVKPAIADSLGIEQS